MSPQNTTDEDSMVVQHILCSRMGKREIKPPAPEVKTESLTVKDEDASNVAPDIKTKEEESDVKEETSEKESEVDKKDEKDTEVPEENKSNETDNAVKDSNKEEDEVTEPKQETVVTEVKPQIVEVEEYFVKYRNFSYLHCEWRTEEELYKGDKRIQAKLKRFKQRQQQNTNIFENVNTGLS